MVLGVLLILAGVYLLSSGPRAAPAQPTTGGVRLGGILLALGTALLWAIGTIILTPISQKAHPFAVNCVRQSGGALLFFALMPKLLGLQQLKALTRKELGTMAAAGLLAGGAGALLFITSLRYAGASISSALSAATPIFSTPLSILFLSEKATKRVAAGSVLIIIGVWLVILG
jgi:drug/metabolite transporter (DMT)-like permease